MIMLPHFAVTFLNNNNTIKNKKSVPMIMLPRASGGTRAYGCQPLVYVLYVLTLVHFYIAFPITMTTVQICSKRFAEDISVPCTTTYPS
jgi:hypothetical protein